MTPEQLDAIAQREAHCKPFGETVTLSRAERDALVALARRYGWLRDDSQDADLFGSNAPYVVEGQTMAPLTGEELDAAIDAATAKEW
ncbi:hypothetical protein F1536_12605 [Achromobacter xylosoxidans]|uniref:hypothetical protein n=1 Tax=Alcaligenes xylosoxydans xylosoxydans TaxID=85698 RepID=UPI001232B808|nr:hypothetical protein [Achromobacter xylosoxidans]KAA5926385.1 hypothetical protein F1536_12605 [Achromobacter xylosoxidans]